MRRTNTLVWVTLLAGCPVSEDASTDSGAMTESDSTAGSDDGDTTCTPGAQVACVCTSGDQGIQICNADGSAFDACDCGEDTSGGTSSGSPDDTGTTTAVADDSSGGSDSSTSDTGMDMCTPGVPEPCDCPNGPGFRRCDDVGELGECLCCEGTHPLVEGDLRYCEAGDCYCGALRAIPPIDVCYDQMVADLCCPGDIDLVCY